MDRKAKLKKNILEYLKENNIKEDNLIKTKDNFKEWSDIAMILTTNFSDIVFEIVENEYDKWGIISYLIPIKNTNTYYTIILDNQLEKLDIKSIDDLVNTIIEYENLAKNLSLIKNNI